MSNNEQCQPGNEGQKMLDEFWSNVMNDVQNVKDSDFKNQELPLARIKKIMKLDEDVGSMVSVCVVFSSFRFAVVSIYGRLDFDDQQNTQIGD